MARGAGPDDHELFGAPALPSLRAAVDDLSWLLGRGYAQSSALELVGNRYELRARQRLAVLRCTCREDQRRERARRRLAAGELEGRPLGIDGVNVLIASLAGVVSTGDAWILDQAAAHFDLAAAVVSARCPDAWVLDLQVPAG